MRQVVAVFCQALWLFLLQVLKHKVISTLPREGGTLNPQCICGWYQPASEAHVTEKNTLILCSPSFLTANETALSLLTYTFPCLSISQCAGLHVLKGSGTEHDYVV